MACVPKTEDTIVHVSCIGKVQVPVFPDAEQHHCNHLTPYIPLVFCDGNNKCSKSSIPIGDISISEFISYF